MLRKTLAVAAVVAVLGAGAVGLAGPAAAAGVTVGLGPGLGLECHADITVTPGSIFWTVGYDPVSTLRTDGWEEDANLSGSGTCWENGAQVRVTLSGSWRRFGGGRDTTTGQCPRAEFFPIIHTGGTFNTYQTWLEMTEETAAAPSRQIDEVNPFYEPPGGVPVGTDALNLPVATSFAVTETDPAACAAWPTVSFPPPLSFPAPAPFHVAADWNVSGFPVPLPPSLLSLCLTVQGVVPRTCLAI